MPIQQNLLKEELCIRFIFLRGTLAKISIAPLERYTIAGEPLSDWF